MAPIPAFGRPLIARLPFRTVTAREKAHAVLDHLPEDRLDAALAALEAVEGRDTSVDAILARHGEQRLDAEEFEHHFASLPSDDEG